MDPRRFSSCGYQRCGLLVPTSLSFSKAKIETFRARPYGSLSLMAPALEPRLPDDHPDY